MSHSPEFDIALSFAGEDRIYVDQVARLLRDRGIRVFYDLFEEADLWGKDLYTYLIDLYQNRAKFTVMFISVAYRKKRWANHERQAAQARAFQESQEYILPARFDDTDIPGVLPTTGYVSLQNRSPDQLVSLITRKLVSSGGTIPSEFVRKDFSTIRTLPRLSPTMLSVRVIDDEGTPIQGCTAVALADNGTTLTATTGVDGTAPISVHWSRIRSSQRPSSNGSTPRMRSRSSSIEPTTSARWSSTQQGTFPALPGASTRFWTQAIVLTYMRIISRSTVAPRNPRVSK